MGRQKRLSLKSALSPVKDPPGRPDSSGWHMAVDELSILTSTAGLNCCLGG